MTNTYILAGHDSLYQHFDADGFDAGAGDTIYVGAGAFVYGFAQTAGDLDVGIKLVGSITMTIDGTVAGSYQGISGQGSNLPSAQITIDRTGVVETTAPENSGQAIFLQGSTMRISNAGTITGEVFMGGNGNTVVNSGSIDGLNQIALSMNGRDAQVTNTGTIVGGSDTQSIHYGAVDFGDPNGLDALAYHVLENDGTISGVLGATYFSTGSSEAQIINHGTISATSGPAISARDGFNGGNEAVASTEDLYLTNTGTISAAGSSDTIIAQSDFLDRIDNSGTISAPPTRLAIAEEGTGRLNVTNTGHIVGGILFGSQGGFYDGTLGSIDGVVEGGAGDNTLLGGADNDLLALHAGDHNIVEGNGGDDELAFSGGGLTKNTIVDGGDGDDTIFLSLAGPVTAKLLTHVSSVETIDLSISNSIVPTDALVTSAANRTVTVNGSDDADVINASKVTIAANHVVFNGGSGADVMYASAGADTFAYGAVAESTGKTFDVIHTLNFAKDRIELPTAAADITGIDAAITSGKLDTSTFNNDLATATHGHLAAAHAVLFTPTTGFFAHDTFLVVDLNGTAGYQSGQDLVIQLAGATGTLAVGDFT